MSPVERFAKQLSLVAGELSAARSFLNDYIRGDQRCVTVVGGDGKCGHRMADHDGGECGVSVEYDGGAVTCPCQKATAP